VVAVAPDGDVALVWMTGEPGAPRLGGAVRDGECWHNLPLAGALAGPARYPAVAAAAEVATDEGGKVEVVRVGP
jgi:hypothetical protein